MAQKSPHISLLYLVMYTGPVPSDPTDPKRHSPSFVWLVGFLTSSSTTRLYRGRAPRQERLTILRAATHETELGDHDFCLSRSHYTDTDPTCRERAATAGIEPGTSSPGVARSTAELPPPPPPPHSPSRSYLWLIDEHDIIIFRRDKTLPLCYSSGVLNP